MFELHVWGPAFGLPSIDPHCLAAIAYLQKAVPEGMWILKASSNPSLSPTHELPALRDGNIWIGGFRNIFHYLAQHSTGNWILDVHLSEQQGADCVAYSSFLDYTARPLLDLSLYVSSENYSKVTRSVYSNMQPFPLPYLTPDAIRSAARSHTQHLGLDSLGTDSRNTSEKTSSHPFSSILPENLQRTKHTVSSLLAACPESKAQIQLDALASKCFEPIENLRAKKRYLLSNLHITSLDCLALGYLSLMLIPELPQPWLAKTMRQKFPRLSAWTQELRTEIFGGAIGSHIVFSEKKQNDWSDRLPWKKPEPVTFLGRSQLFFSALFDGFPGIGLLKGKNKIKSRGAKSENDIEISNTSRNIITSLFVIFLATASTGISWIIWDKYQTSQERVCENSDDDNGLNAYGDVGTILGAYAQQSEYKFL